MIDTLGPARPMPPGRKFPFSRLTLADMECRCVRCMTPLKRLRDVPGREHGGLLCADCCLGRGDAA